MTLAAPPIDSELSERIRRADLLRDNARGTAASPVSPEIGDKYGDLTVVALIGRRANGTKVWALVCVCGGDAIRDTGRLNQTTRAGGVPQCPRCLSELRGGKAAIRRSAARERYLDQWEATGAIWSEDAVSAMTRDIRAELAAEFGEAEEWSPGLDAMTLDGRLAWEPPPSYRIDAEERERRKAEQIADDAKKWKRLISGRATKPLLDFANRDADKARRSAVAHKAVATKRRRADDEAMT